MQMDTLLQHRRMSESTKRPRDEATEPVATCKKTKSISFSISSILGHMDNIQETGAVARGEATVKREANNSPLSVAIEHQLPYGKENYSDFKSAINNRACSTPEDDECPSPTLPVPQYGSLLPPQHVVLPDEKFSYGHPALTSCGHMALTSVYAGVPLRPSFTRYQPYRTPSLDSVGDRRQTSPGNTSDDFTPRSESHSRLSDFPSTDAPSIPPNYRHVNHSDHGLDSLGESYHNSPSPLKCRKKKTRTVFSRNQIYQLESAFDLKRYLSTAERASLAGRLQLSETQVKIWFQNRRNKWKRQISGEMDEIPLPPAFHMPGLISPPFSHQPISAYPSMVDPRDEMIRGRMLVPSIYPSYSQESSFLPPVL